MDQVLQNNVNEVDNNVEVITDDEVNKDIISIDQLINQNNNNQPIVNQTTPIQVQNQESIVNSEPINVIDNQSVTPKKKDKILMIQIILIIVWAVLTAIIYFFGYDLFEPFIRV